MMLQNLLHVILFFVQVILISSDKITIGMKDVVTLKEDEYVCTSIQLKEKVYPIGFESHSKSSVAHHILLYACNTPNPRPEEGCHSPCFSRSIILYAWAMDAGPLRLPKNVSFEIGEGTIYNHVVMQVHYKNKVTKPDNSKVDIITTPHPLPKIAGVLLMANSNGVIPKHKKGVPLAIACQLKTDSSITPFAVRVHAHTLARTNFAYWFPHDSLSKPLLIGRGSPQWPQAFYPSSMHKPIHNNDYLIGFCVYDSTSRNRDTYIGSTHKDEMCNVYIMYSRSRPKSKAANDEELKEEMELKEEIELKEAKGSEEEEEEDSGTWCGDGVDIPSALFKKLVDRIPKDAFSYLPLKRPKKLLTETQSHGSARPTSLIPHEPVNSGAPSVVSSSFAVGSKLGQVAGVAVDSHGRLFVFHRGGRKWDDTSFDVNNRFRHAKSRGPIKEATVLVVDRASGNLLFSFGDNRFYLPHGITIDARDNVWLTDVALHQVFRFDAGNFSAPSLTLGHRLKPGSGHAHFCKPTDIAVQSDGSFFVADGYCNARIVAFSPTGRYLRNLVSSRGKFQIPHSLALVNRSLLCCADRERAHLECFRPADGKPVLRFHAPVFGAELYAICKAPDSTMPNEGAVVHGVAVNDEGQRQGFTYALDQRKVLARWGPRTGRPHDVTAFGADIFVAELDEPFRVLRFEVTEVSRAAAPNLPILVSESAPTHATSRLSTGSWTVVKANLPLVIGVVLMVPLAIIAVGAIFARLHRRYLRQKSRSYKERERAKFKALINEEDSESDGEMTLMQQNTPFRYGAPRASPNPRNT